MNKILLQNFNHSTHLATCPCPIGYPSPVPGGAIGQSLVGCLLLNITMFVTNLALERSEQNFVTKFNHVTPCLGSLLHVHAQWVTPIQVPGGGRESGGRFTIEYYKIVHEAAPGKE